MYEITHEQQIHGDLRSVWDTATDVAGWSLWDPHEEDARLDGPFAVGTRGWSKPHGGPGTDWELIEAEPLRVWGSRCPLPGGGLTGRTEFTDLGDGIIECRKSVWVRGPLTILFRLWFGPRIRRDMARSLAALEHEAARRTTSE